MLVFKNHSNVFCKRQRLFCICRGMFAGIACFLRFTLYKEGKREADCTRNYGCSQQTLQSQTVVYENIGQSADNKARSRKIICTSAFCKITFFAVQLVKICAACSGSKTKGRTFNNSFNNEKSATGMQQKAALLR